MIAPARTQYVVLYARFSPRSRAHQCPSCDVQLDDLRRYCAGRGWLIAGEFRDDAVSGKSEVGRRGLRDAMAACKRGYIFLCRDQKRLARNMLDAFSLVSRLARRGVTFETLHDGSYDPRDPNKLGMFGMRAVFAEMERLRTSIDTKAKMRRFQRENRLMGSIPMLGKIRDPQDPKRTVDDPDQQRSIARILELNASGLSLRKIAAQLDSEGFRNPNGDHWTHTLVQSVLKREKEKTP